MTTTTKMMMMMEKQNRKNKAKKKTAAKGKKTPHGSTKRPLGAQRKHRTSAARTAKLETMIAEAVVDAYDESEQRMGLLTMIEDNLPLPFETEVLGVRVSVERIELTPAEEIVAVCRRGSKRQRISILELPLLSPPPAGAEWIEAYRRWAGGT